MFKILPICLAAGVAIATAIEVQVPTVSLLGSATADRDLTLVVEPSPQPVRLDAIAARCKQTNGCAFSWFGRAGNGELHYVIRSRFGNDPDYGVITVFELREPELLRPLIEAIYDKSLYLGGKPTLHATKYGPVIRMPFDVPGTGNMNRDVVLHWTGTEWQQIDTVTWRSELQLPRCYGVWKGRRLNLDSWQLTIPVWAEGDANCCPTGGEIHASFELRNRTIHVATQRPALVPLSKLESDPDRRGQLKKCLAQPEG
jgi:hypothetical protein